MYKRVILYALRRAGISAVKTVSLDAEREARTQLLRDRDELQRILDETKQDRDKVAANLAEQVVAFGEEATHHKSLIDAEKKSLAAAQSSLRDLTADLGQERLDKETIEKSLAAAQSSLTDLTADLGHERVDKETIKNSLAVNVRRLADLRFQHEVAMKDLAEVARELNLLKINRTQPSSITNAKNEDDIEPVEGARVIVVSLPYSNSAELSRELAEAINGRVVVASKQTFPKDELKLDAFSSGDFTVSDTRLNASSKNHLNLQSLMSITILHVQDPRQIIVDRALAYINGNDADGPENSISPSLSETAMMEFSDVLDWQIKNFVPSIGHWLEKWIEYLDTRPNRPVLLSREDINNRVELFHSLTPLIPLKRKVSVEISTEDFNPWRRVLSEEQARQVILNLPSSVCQRYSWSDDGSRVES